MSRRDFPRTPPRLSLLACALAAVAVPAMAQSVGTSTRFTPVLGDASTLYPRSPASVDAAPEAVPARPGQARLVGDEMRAFYGDGNYGGYYQRADDEMLALWEVAIAETRALIAEGWE